MNKVDEVVPLAGWVANRRDHGKLIFIDLRDRSGVCQVVFGPWSGEEIYAQAQKLRSEWVIQIQGLIKKRPENMVNADLPTGTVEVDVKELTIINESQTPPFPLEGDGYEIDEEARMKYKYLDLRRDRLQKNLALRHRVIKFIRDYLDTEGFYEVETPILTKSTPEGARDYVVSSRLYTGSFYALPQSPQQYKQLLMVAGMERYFQIARCFRDEDTRGDRQPEFTQLDIELSFPTQEEILSLIESLFINLVKVLYPEKRITQTPFPRLSYKEAMEKYNSDKPDLRKDKNDPNELAFVFVVDFPAFEWKESEKRWDATHHPFTKPNVLNAEDFKKKFKEDAGAIFAEQYDLALNGFEIAGGSIRIHDSALLQSVFEAMGNKTEDVIAKFGHMLEAFQYGVPPHGGIASGLDRVMAILENEPNIREVIAFPKTGDGRDLMMDAPSDVTDDQLRELHIKVREK